MSDVPEVGAHKDRGGLGKAREISSNREREERARPLSRDIRSDAAESGKRGARSGGEGLDVVGRVVGRGRGRERCRGRGGPRER